MAVSSAVAQRIRDALGDAFARHAGPGLDPLLDGYADQLVPADQRLTLTAAGWAQAFDLALTPDPAWIGHLLGTQIPGGLSVEETRAFITGRAYWRRGTPAAMRAAVQPLLGGTQTVSLFERDGSPWRLTLRVYETEVLPGVTLDQVQAAAATQKPVGIVLTCEIVPTASYQHFADVHGPAYSDVAADFPTYQSAEVHVPEEGTTA